MLPLLKAIGTADSFAMRAPCSACRGTEGRVEVRGGQDCVFCLCGKHQYNAPKTETGRKPRSVQTTHEAVKPKCRARVLERATGRCEICGKPASTCVLHVGHLVSVNDGVRLGLTEAEINSDENLAAMCDECNLGLGDETIPLRLAIAIIKARRADP